MPIHSDAFYALLGIAMRAGALSLGESLADRAISSGEAGLALVDAGASENTRKKFADGCAYYGVPLRLAEPGRLGQAVGRPGRMSAAVRRGKLCDRLLELAEGETRG